MGAEDPLGKKGGNSSRNRLIFTKNAQLYRYRDAQTFFKPSSVNSVGIFEAMIFFSTIIG